MSLNRSFVRAVCLLGLLHIYIGWRLLPDLHVGATGWMLGVLILLTSCVLMPLGMMARSITPQARSDRVAWAGLITMGFFSSLFVLTLLRDVVLALTHLALPSIWAGDVATISAMAVVGSTVGVTLLGFVNARRRARVTEVDVPIQGLPRGLHGFSIVQISDVHVGPTIKRRYVQAIVGAVNALQADVIAITGDLVDGSVRQLRPHVQPLSALASRYGVYFVTGNHEYYSGEQAWTRELRRLGINVLLNEHVVLERQGDKLVLAGVTDYSAHHFDPLQRSDPAAALNGAPSDAAVKIVLAHQPRSAPAAAAAGFDLQLSGHTHGGQFWPWNLFVRLQQPFTAGLDRLDKLWVYTSRGTGYWGPPKRFGAPSEITLIKLVAEQNENAAEKFAKLPEDAEQRAQQVRAAVVDHGNLTVT